MFLTILTNRLTQECKRLGIEDKLNGKKVFCTMKYHRNTNPRSPYALVDLFLFYIGQKRFEENIVCVINSFNRNESNIVFI